jgi:TPR repeat protein
VNKDAEEAVKCFQEEAERKHVGAELFLGLCFWIGTGVSKDVAEAEKWWREAAIQGIVPWRYLAGDDTGGDAPEIEQWWREVANQGSASLQSCMGEFYHFGHGVTQDDAEAIKWYRRAAAQGELIALKQAAWLQATSPNPSVRNGTNAVECAQKVVAAAKVKDAGILDTLAAAYAEAGQFEKAISTEKQAISLASREGEQREYETRLKLYQEKKPYRAELN